MAKIGLGLIQGIRSLFGKNTSNDDPVNLDIIQFNGASQKWELVSGVVGNAVQTSSNVGAGDGLALPRVGNDLPFRSIIAGNGLVITIEVDGSLKIDAASKSFLANVFNTENIASENNQYVALVGIQNEDPVEINRAIVLPDSCILSRMTIGISSNAATASSVMALRINQVDGNQSITIPALTTGIFQDLSNTDLVVNQDIIAYRILKGVGGALQIQTGSIEVITA